MDRPGDYFCCFIPDQATGMRCDLHEDLFEVESDDGEDLTLLCRAHLGQMADGPVGRVWHLTLRVKAG